MDKRLYKSKTDRMLSGVSGGIAEYFDTDPTFVRVAWVLVGLLTAGFALIAYIALAIIVPERAGKPAPGAAESVETELPSDEPEPYEPADLDEAPVRNNTAGRGSIIGGAVLIIVGVLFLVSNFDLLDWFDWRFWPVVLILFGLLLVARRIGDRDRHG